MILRCNPGCGQTKEFPSRSQALAAGWMTATIETKDGAKYFVSCPECSPKWVREALATTKKKGSDG